MNPAGEQILASLREVAIERARRMEDVGLGVRVAAIKTYQHGRFKQTYADMLAHPRFGGAAQFFLDDLYGPGDFTSRDTQFARIVPGLVRMFPREIVATVVLLGQLHALSEQLDTAMAMALPDSVEAACAVGPRLTPNAGMIDGDEYGRAWRSVGDPGARLRQVSMMLAVGEALERYTRNPLLRSSLRLMRGPAQAAGLGALQGFLERGFDTFRAMRGARDFLDVVATRERAFATELFAGSDGPVLSTSRRSP